MPASVPYVHLTVAEPGTFLTDSELSFYTKITRLDLSGNPILIDVEVHADWDQVFEGACVHEQTPIGHGLLIAAGAQIVLTDQEQRELRDHDAITDWKRDCQDADDDARTDQFERESEGRREAGALGLIRSYP